MQLKLRGKNTQVTEAMRNAVDEKLERIRRHFDHIIEGTVEFSVEKNPSIARGQRVEVNLHVKGHTIRAEQNSSDMYGAIDGVVDKLERQIERYKGRVYASKAIHGAAGHGQPLSIKEMAPEAPIVRRKAFDLKPMSPEEASLQLELLAHEFYVFINAETDDVNVIYRRKDGDFGLIERA